MIQYRRLRKKDPNNNNLHIEMAGRHMSQSFRAHRKAWVAVDPKDQFATGVLHMT